MRIIQSFVQGGRHIRKGQPCEDRTFSRSSQGVYAIALSDGAGNARYTHSAEGAECVTETVTSFLCNNFDRIYDNSDDENTKKVIITVLRRALQEKANQLELDDIMRMSSTLLAAAVKEDKVIILHLGDGLIGALTSGGTELISAPDNGEFANITYFVPTPKAEHQLRLKKGQVGDKMAFFLMSDGSAEFLYNDASGKFTDAARKFALLSFVSNGEQKLEAAIRKNMTEADPTSDDCSFICLMLMDENEGEDLLEETAGNGGHEKVKSNPLQKHRSEWEDEETDRTGCQPDNNGESEKCAKQSEGNHFRSRAIVFAVILIMVLAVIGGIYLKNRKSKETAETEETEMFESSETEETDESIENT